jgi:hypothetical protein
VQPEIPTCVARVAVSFCCCKHLTCADDTSTKILFLQSRCPSWSPESRPSLRLASNVDHMHMDLTWALCGKRHFFGRQKRLTMPKQISLPLLGYSTLQKSFTISARGHSERPTTMLKAASLPSSPCVKPEGDDRTEMAPRNHQTTLPRASECKRLVYSVEVWLA